VGDAEKFRQLSSFFLVFMVITDYIEYAKFGHSRFYFGSVKTLPTFMPHEKFVLAYNNGPLGCLINTRKALGILLIHKIHDTRLRLFLFKWIAALVLLMGAGFRGFNLMPIFLTLVLCLVAIVLCAFFFWLGSEDLFLKFALEDEEFYNLATQSRALSLFNDTVSPQPQPTKRHSVRNGAIKSALTPQEGLRTVGRALLSALLTTIHNRRHDFRSPRRLAISPNENNER
jgi:hypothetical protein